MNKSRLETVYDYLIQHTPVNFSLYSFVENKYFSTVGELKKKLCSKVSCGTTACVCGLFPLIFPEDFQYEIDAVTFERWCIIYGTDVVPTDGRNLSIYDSTSQFLELAEDEWTYLFGPYSYETKDRKDPLVVAERIKNFISTGITPQENE